MRHKPDFRKYRRTKIVNPGTLKTITVNALLDSGAKMTVLGERQALRLNLPKEGNYDLIHSDSGIETTWYSSIFVRIRGEDFLIRVVISKDIQGLIIGSDFMNRFGVRLLFDFDRNDIKIKSIKRGKFFDWDIRGEK